MFALAVLCGLILYRRQFGVLALWSGHWGAAVLCMIIALLSNGAGARLAGARRGIPVMVLSLLFSLFALPAGYFAAVGSCTKMISEAVRDVYPERHPSTWQDLSDRELALEYIGLRLQADGADPAPHWLTFLALRNPTDFSQEPIGAEAAAERIGESRKRWLFMWLLLAAGGLGGAALGARKEPSDTALPGPPTGGVEGIPIPAL